MSKVVDKTKMSKKAQKELNKAQRVLCTFNTGTRTMKTAKHPSRAERKSELRKADY